MGLADPRHRDWNQNEDFFRYTAGRFLFNEVEQLSSRSVKFDMNELAHAASQSIGSTECVDIRKLPEGQYNKTFLLTMANKMQVIAKVPNPNAGLPHYNTASEVATMDFIRNTLKVPLPKIYAWSSRANETPVGAEYIIMENIRGVPLSHKWPDLSGGEKQQLVEAMVDIEVALASAIFKNFGSLYYASDLKPSEYTQQSSLYVNKDGREVVDNRFAVGPTADRKAFDDGRGLVTFDRGPWNTAEEYIMAIAHREIACIKNLKKLPRPAGLFNGPGSYHPTPWSKLLVLQDYLMVAKYLLPIDRDILVSTLWHNDLHGDNIYVNPERPSEIVGLIDWQSAHLGPLLLQVRQPAFLDFNGPKWEGFEAPSLPDNYDELSVEDQQHAKTLLKEQSLSKLYEVQSLVKNNRVYRAMQQQQTLGCQIISLVGNLLQDGEPLVRGQLIQLEREWFKVPRVGGPEGPPCPLKHSIDDIATQERDEAKWLEGMVLMKDLLASLGDVETGWQGWVKHEDYNTFKASLDPLREQFLDYMASNERERAQWDAVWPFRS